MAVVDKVRSMTHTATATRRDQSGGWTTWYVRLALGIDFLSMLVAGALALGIRFRGVTSSYTMPYIAMTASLPFLWVVTLMLCRAYEPRLIGVGSEEFRRVLQSGFVLTASVAIIAYATKTDVARGYVVIALPFATGLNTLARYKLRKRLHRLRWDGKCM